MLLISHSLRQNRFSLTTFNGYCKLLVYIGSSSRLCEQYLAIAVKPASSGGDTWGLMSIRLPSLGQLLLASSTRSPPVFFPRPTGFVTFHGIRGTEMSSSPTPGFQVFLSFRGSETRNGFTSHLSHALKRSGIRTFLDEEDLQKGDIITETIRGAVEGSAVCIPVLSESYADSRWCLMELAMMVKCNKKIIPIFYDVEPTVVRHQSSSYKAAFDRHRLRFDEKTINEWKGALKRVAEISGYDRKNTANG
ncbi:TMV resistance protein [Nymphaea thermarum]|nr:TMV resistance protein [Nymphaea thermarum]